MQFMKNEQLDRRVPFGDMIRGFRADYIVIDTEEIRTCGLNKDECIQYLFSQVAPACNGNYTITNTLADLIEAEKALADLAEPKHKAMAGNSSFAQALWPGLQNWYGDAYREKNQ